MAGIKISNLPAASTPLAGSETIAIVQSTCTKSTPISAIADIVSSSFVTSSQYASTSGAWTTVNSTSANWSGVYSSYQSTSASVARKDACNCFVCPQIFTSVINASKIAAGYSATANGACSSVLGGYYNDANGNGSVVVAGNNNDTWGNFSSIAGGENNCITGDGSNGFIGGGAGITVKHCNAAAFGTCITSVSGDMLHVNRLYVGNLPSTNPGVPGVIWSNAGTLSVSY
jgi:hypothetical protein